VFAGRSLQNLHIASSPDECTQQLRDVRLRFERHHPASERGECSRPIPKMGSHIEGEVAAFDEGVVEASQSALPERDPVVDNEGPKQADRPAELGHVGADRILNGVVRPVPRTTPVSPLGAASWAGAATMTVCNGRLRVACVCSRV